MTMPYSFASFRVQRVVFVERAVPHRGPQIIGLQPEQQFEKALVEKMIEAAVFLVHPIRSAKALHRSEKCRDISPRVRLRHIFPA